MTRLNARPPFTPGPELRELEELLRKCPVGGLVTYDAMSTEIDRDVWEVRSTLYTARKNVQRDHRIVFEPERGVGLRRLDDEQIVSSGSRGFESIRRKCRKQIKTLQCADYQKLSAEKKTEHNLQASCYGAMAVILRPQTIKKIEAAVTVKQETLPLSDTLRAFGLAES